MSNQEELRYFLKRTFSEIWICDLEGEKTLVDFDNLPEDKSAHWHSHFWYLHGEFIDKSAPQNSQTIFTDKNFKSLPSLKEIDLELTNWANKYRWVFFSWGSKSELLLSFGFLSKNHVLRDKVMNLSKLIRISVAKSVSAIQA
ncbi:MAG: hypothetical protein F6K40_01265 [Okeania sp. SIO3I5]|uniref:hypothetical protein n=1 Tax=Okeania sp. SIO3I5 TaxID=2607805 RepID=UPI0013BDE6DB|nr:hypothetical protein [Okeania sp. SIO3I5]NEQ35013.1 hypothetical protein [Okeania sp. SIO3I5]